MRTRTLLLLCLFALPLFLASPLAAQDFSVEEYRRFLDRNAELDYEGFDRMHQAGDFAGTATGGFAAASFSDSIDRVYSLTDYEQAILNRYDFMVTERLSFPSFGDAFHDVYINDLPVFISTDAILHALHKSYNGMLIDVEQRILLPNLEELLAGMQTRFRTVASDYAQNAAMRPSIDDVDLYLSVARALVTDTDPVPAFSRNREAAEEILEFIDAEQMESILIFGDEPRLFDFSQFTLRGHYTQSKELGRYFKTMIWLGRTEVYLSKIEGVLGGPSIEDVRRQSAAAALIAEILEDPALVEKHETIDRTIGFLVGESDNVSPKNFDDLLVESGITRASDLLDEAKHKRFSDVLASKEYAGQKILSQVLIGDPTDPEGIVPPSAWMLFGQRFVIDSYVTGSVVHDKVDKRMLPSTLDVLFALGNDAAGQLLRSEIQEYDYATELAALRYLIDSYDRDFWGSTLYTSWLDAIRTLNPPDIRERSELPPFMRTSAWWQQKMNTQLASWSQLRHDNLLYAKQSYSGGIGCSYPKGYVEPIPAFYDAIVRYAERGAVIFEQIESGSAARNYFERLASAATTLGAIARKELAKEPLSEEEIAFLETTLSRSTVGCGEIIYNGWYPGLFYAPDEVGKSDFIVADVHTAPTDETGNMVGWVLHVGTGNVDMAVVVCSDPAGGATAYVGPVMSYHEHVTTGFNRLTDEEWAASYMEEESKRPLWVNSYLAGKDGENRGEVITLRTGVSSVESDELPGGSIDLSAAPNPSQGAVTFRFGLPVSETGEESRLRVFDATGRPIVSLFETTSAQSGSYFVEWDGRDASGNPVASGTYLVRIDCGSTTATERVTITR